MKSVRKPSVVPVYAVGITWIVYTLIWGLSSIGKVALCAAVSLAVYLIAKTKFPGKTIQVEVPEKAPDTVRRLAQLMVTAADDAVRNPEFLLALRVRLLQIAAS